MWKPGLYYKETYNGQKSCEVGQYIDAVWYAWELLADEADLPNVTMQHHLLLSE